MKRKFSKTEWLLFLVPLLAIALLAARDPLSTWWNRAVLSGVPLEGDTSFLAFSHDGETLIVSSSDRKSGARQLQFVETKTQRVAFNQGGVGGGSVAWSPDDKLFVVVGSQFYNIWDAQKRVLLWRGSPSNAPNMSSYKWLTKNVLELSTSNTTQISPVGVKPIAWQTNVTIYTVDARNGVLKTLGTKVQTRGSSTRSEDPSRFSPDGRWKISLSEYKSNRAPKAKPWGTGSDGYTGQQVLLWNRKTGKLQRAFEGDMFSEIAFVDNRTIAGVARVSMGSISTANGVEAPPKLYTCTMKIDAARSLWQPLESGEDSARFSPNGKFLITQNFGAKRLAIRDPRNWQVVGSHNAANVNMYQMTFSQDGRFLAYSTEKPNRVTILPLPAIKSTR